MTPEAVFKAYDLLSWIPREQVINIRHGLDQARRRLHQHHGQSASSPPSPWPDEDVALAWLIDITRECWCLWPVTTTRH